MSTRAPRRDDRRRRPSTNRQPRDPARRTAYDVLRAVHSRDAYANLLLPSLLRERRLSERDAALATELTYGTLRWRASHDAVLTACSDRALDAIDPPLLDVLRLGTHQLLRTRVPAHAAVATAVELARSVAGPGQARFANAILRKVATRDWPEWEAIVAPDADADPVGHLAVAHSHPRWVVTALRDRLGAAHADEIGALLAADNERPRVTLLAKPGRAEVAELLAAGAEPAAFAPYAAYLAEGDPAGIPAVRQGRAAVCDEAGQLVALALAAAPIFGTDRRWLDLCAGPGGKAGLLSGLVTARGGRLLAVDLQEHRARLARRSVDPGAGVVVADGTRPAWRPGAFDRVLADVPCTGLGALRRRPEARWRRTPGSVAELAPVQRDLLNAAIDSVRPGGVVAYVTCSPHLAETTVVVDDVVTRRGDVRRLDVAAVLEDALGRPIPGLGEGSDAQFWPHRHGADAMFCAIVRRDGE
jgi:16S rRNA (cytosine967-C5)-methyltransferase